ncbi:MAG TPA: class III poly(R)-hydroxyalkanoic acid synthase subunit PhaC [Spirochaetia bacterium]|nr:class III poly(R)-hydroxyalkanoic acid synthase subunit PhaC [Spirochaetia bacterium]
MTLDAGPGKPQYWMNEALSMQTKLLQGIGTMISMQDVDVDLTPKELVFQQDKMRLFHYKPVVSNPVSVPVLIVYALVNRQYMMDLQQERSVIRTFLEQGLDVFLIDWGYPDQADKYLAMEDYIDGYLNDAVDAVRKLSGLDKINLLGVCQGGTFSVIYTALYPQKIKNLVTMVAPIDFSIDDGLLYNWSKYLNIDNLVDVFGVVPGDFMNLGFLLLKPFQLTLDKYVGMVDNLDNPDAVKDFLSMEKWIFDSPGQAGEAFRKFIKDLFQENRLVQNKMELGGRTVNLKNIDMPLLNVFAEQDHLVPPSSSRPLNDLVASKDKDVIHFPGGHIGIFVSSSAQKKVAPAIARWLADRSSPVEKRVTAAEKRESAKSKGSQVN